MSNRDTGFTPRDAEWGARVRNSFARQTFLRLIGAGIVKLDPGAVDLELARRDDLVQQHGYFHAGVTMSLADTAAGYAALSLFPPGVGVLTTELKVNLLNAGRGERLLACGRVVRPGRTLTVCRSDVYGIDNAQTTHVATALLTMMAVAALDD